MASVLCPSDSGAAPSDHHTEVRRASLASNGKNGQPLGLVGQMEENHGSRYEAGFAWDSRLAVERGLQWNDGLASQRRLDWRRSSASPAEGHHHRPPGGDPG